MSIKALSDYTIYAKYAKYNAGQKRRETWKEQVDRVFSMHERKYKNVLELNSEFKNLFNEAREAVYKKQVLGSQRALQFGGPSIEKHNDKMYNCAVTYIDRPRVFSDIMYMLLCGCGVGFSVQRKHTSKLPSIETPSKGVKKFIVPDNIEGWADAIGIIVNSFFKDTDTFTEYNGYNVDFDYSQIRPEGSLISGGFKAPGASGLARSIEKIRTLILSRLGKGETKLHPIDFYDIVMHSSDAVLSGGVRRSATICLFSFDDEEMLKAKTGNWFYENPQRGRSNNSALLLRNKVKYEEFRNIMNSVREFGEPGFVWADNEDTIYNPCVEIGMFPQNSKGQSGVQYCNLTEINGKKCSSEEEFYTACRASAILGTLQAGYTNFKYLGEVTEEIVRREALLGCSIKGMMDNPEVLFNEDIQRRGAEIIKELNKQVAEMIGINAAARCTCVKPAGTTSCVLGTASGIHPHHAKRYFRRVQANKLEFALQEFEKVNPLAVEESVWSNNKTDMVVTFLCEVPAGSIVKNSVDAIGLLERVKQTQQNWVEFGTNLDLCVNKEVRHNVSNTITVKPDEWTKVTDYIYENRKWFAGISLLPASGDKDYPQAPFCTVYTPQEIVKEYGDASVFASGVVVDALKAFDNNLWRACDAALGVIKLEPMHATGPEYPTERNYRAIASYFLEKEKWENEYLKHDWVRRARQFAARYFEGDLRRMTYCLKDIHNWKTWCDLSREYKEIDWSTVIEENPFYENIDTTGAQACAGGKCEVAF